MPGNGRLVSDFGMFRTPGSRTPMVSCGLEHTGASRQQALRRRLLGQRPGLPAVAVAPTADAPARTRSRDRHSTRAREDMLSYVDRTINCVDCGVEFIHSAADQEFYAQKGFAADPKRCPSCRRQSARGAGRRVRHAGDRRSPRLRAQRGATCP